MSESLCLIWMLFSAVALGFFIGRISKINDHIKTKADEMVRKGSGSGKGESGGKK